MANEKILVVDDDTNICELLRLYLTKEGYQVTTAPSSRPSTLSKVSPLSVSIITGVLPSLRMRRQTSRPSIKGIGRLGKDGMRQTNEEIIRLMMS